MNKLAIALIAAATTTGIATAQTSRLEWRVDGNSAAVVNAGDTVLVEGFLSWDIQGVGLSSADYTITLDGADMPDGLNYAEPAFGRNALMLSPAPQVIVDTPTPAGRQIVDAGPFGTIGAFQLPGMFNPFFQTQNPVRVFSFEFTAGDAGRDVTIGGTLTSTAIYTDMMGGSAFANERMVDNATVSIVPTPGTGALIASAGLLATRRRRKA